MKKVGLFLFFALSTTLFTTKAMDHRLDPAGQKDWDARARRDWQIMCMTILDKVEAESAGWCKRLGIRNRLSPNTEIAAIMGHKTSSYARQVNRTPTPVDGSLEGAARRERPAQLATICHSPGATNEDLQKYLELKQAISEGLR